VAMRDIEQMDKRRQRIFELALNIARLTLHSCYLEQGKLTLVAGDEVQNYIRSLTQQLEHEAKSTLMAGDWE